MTRPACLHGVVGTCVDCTIAHIRATPPPPPVLFRAEEIGVVGERCLCGDKARRGDLVELQGDGHAIYCRECAVGVGSRAYQRWEAGL